MRQEQKAQKALNKSEGKGLADALDGFDSDDDGEGNLPQQQLLAELDDQFGEIVKDLNG